ncbi:YkoF family thiamine/hydroxymethylpyrimidine-binding protein [Thermosediminibacter litoriperuensis]|uniref:Thiamine-binding protein n=1 Tax=Thermosediminibacter litoriperuensis TaxID=291989 RepID=A0A5S5ALZ6_9FIRM|nr:YkoF family thiamine/hydroxymethylpyrimidine-binding protein [Thermosediminibacter litoriperuensis]TYP52437.1 thiamine-binding protein [Thermosediminibacter litoriperuensis]
MISCEVSIYPLETQNSDQVVNQALASIKDMGVTCQVGTISTYITGSPEKVWECIRTLYDTASTRAKELSMVVTISNSQKS